MCLLCCRVLCSKGICPFILHVKLRNFSPDINTGECEVCCMLYILVSCRIVQITRRVPVSTAVMWMSFYDTNLLCFLSHATLRQTSRYVPEGSILC